MAEKRDFQEFIDLTGIDEGKDVALPSIESDEGPPAKLSRVEYGRRDEHHLHLSDNNSFFPASSFIVPPPAASRLIKNYPKFDEHLNRSRGSEQPGFLHRGSHLALPITGSGLQKSVYDSNRIARDVLIAFDAHPDRGGLNSHLKTHLLSLFNAISEKPDLGTIDIEYFRMQHTSSRASLHGFGDLIPSNRQIQHTLQNPGAERFPMRNPVILPPRGGGYVGNGGQPIVNFQSQDSHSNHHGNTRAGTWQQHPQQLASVHSHRSSLRYGDTIGGDSRASAHHTYQQHSQLLSYQSQSGYSSPYGSYPVHSVQPQSVPQYEMPSYKELGNIHHPGGLLSTPRAPMSPSAVSVVLPQISETLSDSPGIPARRGRPPESLSRPGAAARESGVPKRMGRPPKDYTALVADNNNDLLLAKTPGCSSNVTYAASNQPSNNALAISVQLPKKRGRPFKNPELANAPAERVPKKRGRPPKDPSSVKKIPLPEPNYLKYKCEWKGCPAELHNLKTLNLHIAKVHKNRENGMFICLWNRCATLPNSDNNTEALFNPSADAHYRFDLEEEWLKHIGDEHMQPYAWYMGDGPRSSFERSERSQSLASASWLHDENGRQVTPSVENQPIEDGNPKRNNAQRFERKVLGLDVIFDPINYDEEPAQEQGGGSREDEGMETDGGEDARTESEREEIETRGDRMDES
ncbi:hypothetical protein ACMFMG_006007 [Clarireedia jacksonii]